MGTIKLNYKHSDDIVKFTYNVCDAGYATIRNTH